MSAEVGIGDTGLDRRSEVSALLEADETTLGDVWIAE
jgi:hypothetical protein